MKKIIWLLSSLMAAALLFTGCPRPDNAVVEYTITVASNIENGTVSVDKTTATEGETVKITVNPNEGYLQDEITVTDSSKNAITITSNTFTMPKSNVVVGATFKHVTFTVTFDSDGGSDVEAQTIISGETATKPADPTKDGFTFAGWYAGETAFDFTTAITADTTLKAKWTATKVPEPKLDPEPEPEVKSYKVTFDTDGGSTAPAEQTVTAGSKATKPVDPTKEGFTFEGWFAGETAFDFTSPITADTTLKAKWTAIEEPKTASKYADAFATAHAFVDAIIVPELPSKSETENAAERSARTAIEPEEIAEVVYVNTKSLEGAIENGTEYILAIKEFLLPEENLEFNKDIPASEAILQALKISAENIHIRIDKEEDEKASLYWTFSQKAGDGIFITQAHKITNYVTEDGDFCTYYIQYWGSDDNLYVGKYVKSDDKIAYSQVMDSEAESFNHSVVYNNGKFTFVKKGIDSVITSYIKDAQGGIIYQNVTSHEFKKYSAFNSDQSMMYGLDKDESYSKTYIPLRELTYTTEPEFIYYIDNGMYGKDGDLNLWDELIKRTSPQEDSDSTAPLYIEAVELSDNENLPEGCTFAKQTYVNTKKTEAEELQKNCEKLVEGVYPEDPEAEAADVKKYLNKITILSE